MHAELTRGPRGLLALLALLLLGLAGCDESQDPLIEAILPARAAPGVAVEIVGERFSGAERQVSFGGVAASVLAWQERRARAIVPAGIAGLTIVVITIDGRPSNPKSFFVEGSVGDGGG